MIDIRKLAAVDMAWLGPHVIAPEYALGVILPLGLGLRSLYLGLGSSVAWEIIVGIWLLSIGVNYIPLLVYAILIVKAGTVKQEGQREIAHARRYGLQQTIILVPLMVVVVALFQEASRRTKSV